MKSTFKLLTALSLILIIVSCGDDKEVTPPHEVGNWNLVNFAFLNVPAGFTSNEGVLSEINEISFGGLRFSSYTLSIKSDGSYSREIATTGRLPQKDKGTWENKKDEFIFIDSDDNEDVFNLEKNEDDQFWFSASSPFAMIPDTTITRLFNQYSTGTAVNAYLDSLSDEEYSALLFPVVLDLVFVFERKK
jgi:hypothetical protein